MNQPKEATVTQPLILCPRCNMEMRLFGVEAESEVRDLYTFDCARCGQLEIRGVLVSHPK
jgi:hypothetical protein